MDKEKYNYFQPKQTDGNKTSVLSKRIGGKKTNVVFKILIALVTIAVIGIILYVVFAVFVLSIMFAHK